VDKSYLSLISVRNREMIKTGSYIVKMFVKK